MEYLLAPAAKTSDDATSATLSWVKGKQEKAVFSKKLDPPQIFLFSASLKTLMYWGGSSKPRGRSFLIVWT